MKIEITQLYCVAVVLALLGSGFSQGMEQVPPEFRGLPGTVQAGFNFPTDDFPPTANQFNWIEGPGGQQLQGNQGINIVFEPGDFLWNPAGGGSWTAIGPGPETMRVQLPNIVDDFPVKYFRVQVRWRFAFSSAPPFLGGVTGEDAEDGLISEVTIFDTDTVLLGGNFRQTFYDVRVRTSPDSEQILLNFQPGMSVFNIVVDTISVPEETDADADSVQVLRGMHVSGTLEDTFVSDDSFLVFKSSMTSPMAQRPNRPPVSLVFTSQLQSQPSDVPVAIEFTIESHVTEPGTIQTIELFNWTTGKYDLLEVYLDSGQGPPNNSIGVTVFAAEYICLPFKKVRARVSWRPVTQQSPLNFNVVLDWINFKFANSFFDE